MLPKAFTVCTTCVMDSSAKPFVPQGSLGCNYCLPARARLSEVRATSDLDLQLVIKSIKRRSRHSKYDCVIGISGGVDSSWLLQWAVVSGLRVLAVHMDNCWNTSQASINVFNLVSRLDCDLFTVVLPWSEERSAKRALLAADVVDVELLYDNALHKVCFETARRFGIKTILGGQNNASEGVEIPGNWAWKKFDGRNLISILKAGGADYTRLPILTSIQWLAYLYIRRISWINILDLIPSYRKESAVEHLIDKFAYVPYGYKHYENVFTRYYQGEILPVKFGIDKRKAHLSSQIVAGEISRQAALEELNRPTYHSEATLRLDREMVMSKLGMSDRELANYLAREPRSHTEFKVDLFLRHVVPSLLIFRKLFLKIVPKRRAV